MIISMLHFFFLEKLLLNRIKYYNVSFKFKTLYALFQVSINIIKIVMQMFLYFFRRDGMGRVGGMVAAVWIKNLYNIFYYLIFYEVRAKKRPSGCVQCKLYATRKKIYIFFCIFLQRQWNLKTYKFSGNETNRWNNNFCSCNIYCFFLSYHRHNNHQQYRWASLKYTSRYRHQKQP